jgi:hypothetical protein
MEKKRKKKEKKKKNKKQAREDNKDVRNYHDDISGTAAIKTRQSQKPQGWCQAHCYSIDEWWEWWMAL